MGANLNPKTKIMTTYPRVVQKNSYVEKYVFFASFIVKKTLYLRRQHYNSKVGRACCPVENSFIEH
jgi:hypothetical protein